MNDIQATQRQSRTCIELDKQLSAIGNVHKPRIVKFNRKPIETDSQSWEFVPDSVVKELSDWCAMAAMMTMFDDDSQPPALEQVVQSQLSCGVITDQVTAPVQSLLF